MQQIEFQEKEEKMDIKKMLSKYLIRWPWFLVSVFLFLTGAYIYLRYSIPLYKSQTTLKFDKKENNLSSAFADLDNLGNGLMNSDELKSEAAVVTSRPILTKVVKNLNLNVQYYDEGDIKDTELFEDTPITASVVSFTNEKKFKYAEYYLTNVRGNQFTLGNKANVDFKGTFDQPLNVDFGSIVLHKERELSIKSKYKIIFYSPLVKAKELEQKIVVDLPDQKAFLMNVSITGEIPEKSEAILNEITHQYNMDGLKDKNLKAQNTQEFIDNRLEVITHDLSQVEKEKEDFQNKNRIVDLEEQAKLALQGSSDNTKILLQQQTQLSLLNSLEAEASKGNGHLMPSNLGLNPSLEQAIEQYNSALIIRNKTLKQATSENPAVIEMNKEISSLKEIVRDNIRQEKSTVNASIGQISNQISLNSAIIDKVPGQSKIYRGIGRQQNLKEQLFLFLLQKREENAINLSVNEPKAKIVNPAYTQDTPVSPKNKIVFLFAILLGILLPLLIIYLYIMWDDKVYNRDDVKEHSSGSILAEIPSLKKDVNHYVEKNDFSELAESFRVLVSNLRFVLPVKDSAKVIMVTSSIKGEGKTFLSMNLALSLGSEIGKALFIGSDVRNPKTRRSNPKQKNLEGLTEYLSNKSTQIDDLIEVSITNPYCDVMYAGAIPPNPQELLSNGRYEELIKELSTQYEYIIIDSAPLMPVSDTFSITNVADVTLYVVRSGVTRNFMLDYVVGLVKESKLLNLSFVINGVSKKSKGYGYKYGYGYGYSKDEKKPWWRKLLKHK